MKIKKKKIITNYISLIRHRYQFKSFFILLTSKIASYVQVYQVLSLVCIFHPMFETAICLFNASPILSRQWDFCGKFSFTSDLGRSVFIHLSPLRAFSLSHYHDGIGAHIRRSVSELKKNTQIKTEVF